MTVQTADFGAPFNFLRGKCELAHTPGFDPSDKVSLTRLGAIWPFLTLVAIIVSLAVGSAIWISSQNAAVLVRLSNDEERIATLEQRTLSMQEEATEHYNEQLIFQGDVRKGLQELSDKLSDLRALRDGRSR